ncbi:MAG: tol-pal system protein YbgF [Hyphomicrobiaceae bacterium]
MRDQGKGMAHAAKTVAAMLATVAVALAIAGPSRAQQGWNAHTNSSEKASKSKASKSAKAATEDTAHRGSDAQLRQRIEQLEEQLADVQVTMGTLESLGRGGGGGGQAAQRPSGGGGVDQARLDSLEIQLRALAAQVEELSRHMRQVERRGDAGALAAPERQASSAPAAPQGSTLPAGSSGFGNVTVTPSAGDRDPIGSLLSGSRPAAQPASATLPPAAANAASPRELYETAYGYLLQQDYGSAEATFDEFLRRYPKDRQAADAQYWYGETLYVQRRYKPAGHAFLKVIEGYNGSSKVPHSILKLAMSLEQLGQKDCGLFTALETRHPSAPADITTKARALKQRVGC